ncbi:hypothetical protein GRAN_4817 [Granulicella sibirica]|uniref:Uncharacterized protein n=1 Tax=Granulicella sibirica TaxID=2479048 RepID=A0A4Q0SYP9_9BACT|nr:hypothetical protein GRAN_4817 [Granulicella sibirica]
MQCAQQAAGAQRAGKARCGADNFKAHIPPPSRRRFERIEELLVTKLMTYLEEMSSHETV